MTKPKFLRKRHDVEKWKGWRFMSADFPLSKDQDDII
jgi:hypothetical protein